MGCSCSKKYEVTPTAKEKYIGFHEGRIPPPEPTNATDERYHEVHGESATFAVGPFREGQAEFALLPGIIRTRVGYAGGKAVLGPKKIIKIHDHTEVVDIEFDPFVIKYEKLLEFFWKTHDPVKEHHEDYAVGPADRRLFSVEHTKDTEGKCRHYSKIFYHSREQRRLAEEALVQLDRAIHSQTKMTLHLAHIRTDLVPADHIYLANKEDQQYYLQQDDFLSNVVKCSTREELVYSHLAAKLNGLCSPYATLNDLAEAEKDFDLGLSQEVIAYLKKKIQANANKKS